MRVLLKAGARVSVRASERASEEASRELLSVVSRASCRVSCRVSRVACRAPHCVRALPLCPSTATPSVQGRAAGRSFTIAQHSADSAEWREPHCSRVLGRR